MTRMLLVLLVISCTALANAQTNPLWTAEKVKNYLPHMSWPEVEALAERARTLD